MQRVKAFDVIRAVSAVMVVLFHFACLNGKSANWVDYPLLHGMENWRLGRVAVTLFFMLSGCLLYRNYSTIERGELKEYYYKRWKSIFPQFYIVFIGFYLLTVIERKNLFWLGKPYLLVLSFLGMDGYFGAWVSNYYMVGEWFLGAILLIYIFYPFVLRLFNKIPIVFVGVCAIAFGLICYHNIFKIEIGMNMISCVFKFSCGMLFYKYIHLMKNKIVALFASLLLIFCMFNRNIHIEINEFVLGALLFVLLYNLGDFICSNKIINSMISFTSNISFAIFLFQHKVIVMWADVARENMKMNLFFETIILILIILTTWGLAYVLDKLVKKIYKSNMYMKIESIILARLEK